MSLTNKPRNRLDLFDLDLKLTVLQLKVMKQFYRHSVPQSELLAWCRLHSFGRDKSIASLVVMTKIGLIFRDYVQYGVLLFDEPVKEHKHAEVGYKITYLGEEFLAFLRKMGIPELQKTVGGKIS